MLAHDVDELGIALGRPDSRGMPHGPQAEADEPEAEAKAERGGQRAVEYGERTRRAAEITSSAAFGKSAVSRTETARKCSSISGYNLWNAP